MKNKRLEKLSEEVKAYALETLERRFWRLTQRQFVLFPYLRAKILLKRIAFLKAFLILSLVLVSCTKQDATPGPVTPTVSDFKLQGKTVSIEGKIKAPSKLKAESAKLHLQTALDMLETH